MIPVMPGSGEIDGWGSMPVRDRWEQRNRLMIVYFNGRYQPEEEVRISPNERGLHFADGVYEVVRAYRGRPFRLPEHCARLERSLKAVRMDYDDLDEVSSAAVELIGRNSLSAGNALIYIQVTRGEYRRSHTFPPASIRPNVYLSASPFTPYRKEYGTGVRVTLAPDIRWSRCDIKSIALLPNVLARQEAEDRGALEAVFVRDGVLTEGSRTNIGGIRGGTFITPPKSNFILAGITRDTVIGLCGEIGIPVTEGDIPADDLVSFDELMLMGTTVEVMPIIRVDDLVIGGGVPGPLTVKLIEAFRTATAVNGAE